MTHIRFLLIHVTLVFLLIGCSKSENEIETINEFDSSINYEGLDIPYGTDIEQTFDLFLPAKRTQATKILILIHGGGWTSGDKNDMNFVKELIKQDFPDVAIANINYRLAGSNTPPYPMQINDITAVIAFLKDNKEKYSLSQNIGFIGISAGAHLSMLWSYAFDVSNRVNMVCSIVGPTNFTDPAYLNNTSPIIEPLIDLFGKTPEIEFLEEVSPYHQVKSSAPPTILFYAEQDELVPISQGIAMRDKLIELQIPHEFTLYPDVGHGLGVSEILDLWGKLRVYIKNNL
ncbi:alpha/beta hydrolase [uncultured Algibacter sp.]|uniref:alpha/beta hydrolase n=1 Tax=uncultured Algibacter sp. TaxID=298659 RepID=UPI00262666C6|nr:alpha/beta hydrolase [uncultured Algibacter sp.]